MSLIQDGSGQGYIARVNSDNRLYTFADSVPSGANAAANKRMWSIFSGDVTQTDDNESGLLYISYSGTSKLVISQIAYTVGTSTGGSGSTAYRFVANPLDGTLVSTATQASIINRNLSGVSGSLIGNQYSGTQGATITGGSDLGVVSLGSGFLSQDESKNPFILETGNSIAVGVTPPTGNTSQTNRIFLTVYELVVD